MVIEIITGVLVAALAIVTIFAAYIGVAGMFGHVYFSSCTHCGRRSMSLSADPHASCVNCRHELLLHPVASAHRVHHSHGHAA